MKCMNEEAKFSVYRIEVGNVVYLGRTMNFERRLKEHCRDCYNVNSRVYNKLFYQNVREIHLDKESGCNALKKGFSIVYKCKTKVESKQRELWLILNRFFNGEELFQKIPSISDR